MGCRPECKICYETITVGSCKCGTPHFGFVRIVDGKRVPETRPCTYINTEDYSGWVVKETGEPVAQ